MIKIIVSSKFTKSSKRLSERVKTKAKEKTEIFRNNPFDSRLETHQLHGKYKGFWAFSIDKNYRIMFDFGASMNEVVFINVGTHEIYK